ncbi:MAG: DUF3429 domain-containing protein, partial [Pseudomonadota bacterium]
NYDRMKSSTLYTALALAGATPFLACAVLPLVGIDTIEPLGALDSLASSYGLAILCFLAGAHWATYLLKQADIRFNLFISSNIVFLVVWLSFVIANLELALGLQVIAFLYLLFVDYRLLSMNVISNTYFKVRSLATALAVVSLSVILFSQ